MELPGEENPLEHVAGLKQAPILSLVLPKETQVSEKQIVSEDMPENRENQTGHGTFEDVESEGGTLDSVLLGGYIQEHFADFLDEPKNMPSGAFLEPEFPLLRLFCVLYSKKLQKIWWFQKNVVNLHRD